MTLELRVIQTLIHRVISYHSLAIDLRVCSPHVDGRVECGFGLLLLRCRVDCGESLLAHDLTGGADLFTVGAHCE